MSTTAPAAMPATLSVDIPRDLRAPARARRAVERLAAALDATVLADVRLLVSELVTNSVKYGDDGAVTLAVDAHARERVHVQVVDQGVGFVPVPRERPVTEAGGWRLHLVQTLSDRWGVHDGSTHVWFEVDRRRASQPRGGDSSL